MFEHFIIHLFIFYAWLQYSFAVDYASCHQEISAYNLDKLLVCFNFCENKEKKTNLKS